MEYWTRGVRYLICDTPDRGCDVKNTGHAVFAILYAIHLTKGTRRSATESLPKSTIVRKKSAARAVALSTGCPGDEHEADEYPQRIFLFLFYGALVHRNNKAY